MTILLRLIGLIWGCLMVNIAWGQANDEPCTATALPVGTSCTYTAGTNLSATASATIPLPSCALSFATRNDVWFRFTLTQASDIQIQTRAGTMQDGFLQLFTATNCQTGLQELGCNDDASAGNLMPALQMRNLSSGTYYIRIGSTGSAGTFDICVQANSPLTSTFTVCDSIVVSGKTTAITYTGSAPSTANYYWSFDDGVANPGTGGGLQRVTWTTPGTKTVALTVEQNGISSATTTHRVQVVATAQSPTATISGASQTACQGQLITIPLVLTGSSPWSVTYTERTDSGTQTKILTFGTGADCNPTLFNLTATPVTSTTFTVTRISDANFLNITQNAVATVTVSGNGTLPTVTLTTSSLTALTGQAVTITNNGNSSATYLWDFGDAIASPGTGAGQQIVSWNSTGSKFVRLRISQGSCLSSPASVSVLVRGSTSLANDEPCSALDWPVSTTCSFGATSNAGATPTGFAKNTSTCLQRNEEPADSWYKFTLTQISSLVVATQAGTLTDGVMELYADNPCSGVQPFRVIACDDNSIGLMPLLTIPNLKAGTYWVRFWGKNRQTGTFNLCIQARPASLPTASFSVNSLTVCSADTARFNLLATGTGPWTIYYERTINTIITQDSINIGSGLASSPYAYPIKQVNSQNTRYRITGVRDANFGRQTVNNIFDLFITPRPTIAITSSVTQATIGQSVSLSYTGNADNQAVFSWNLDGGTVVSGTGRGPLAVSWSTPGAKKVQLTITQNGCQSISSVLSISIAGNNSISIDEPCNAAEVTVFTGSCPGNLPSFSMSGATSNTIAYGTCWSSSQKDVWLKFSIPTAQPITISVLNSTLGDGDIQLLSATACTGPFTQVGCETSSGPGFLSFSSLNPGTYYFRIFDYNGGTNGNFSLCVSTVAPNARFLSSETTVCRGTAVAVPISVSGSGATQLIYDEIADSGTITSRTLTVSNATTTGVATSLSVTANQTIKLVLRSVKLATSTTSVPLSGTYTISVFSTSAIQVSLAASTSITTPGQPVTIQQVGNLDLLGGDRISWDFAQANTVPGTGTGPHTVFWNTPGLKTVSISVDRANCQNVTSTQRIRVLPVNDEPCNAIPIPISSSICKPVIQYSLAGATSSTQTFPTCGYSTSGQGDVWFQVVISGTQTVGITTSAGSIADVAMQVFSAATCQSSMSLVSCTDYNYYITPTSNMPEARLANLRPGTYYIRIIAQSSLEGTFGICAYTLPPPSASFTVNSFSNCSGTSVPLPIRLSGNSTVQLNYAEISNGITTNRQVSISSGVTNYTLLVAPTQRTIYRLISLTDAIFTTPVTLKDSAIVEVMGTVPSSTFATSSSLVNTGQSLTITYTGTGIATDRYQWDFAGGIIVSGSQAGPYEVKWLAPGSRIVKLTVLRNQYCSSPTVSQIVSVTGLNLHDQVCDAIALPVQTLFCSVPPIQYSIAGSTSGGSTGCSPPGTDVWFKFTLPASASVVVNTSSGTLQYGQVQVLSGSSCTSLTQVACTGYPTNATAVPSLTLNSLAAGTYFIRVSGYNNISYTTFGICISQLAPPAVSFAAQDTVACIGQPITIPIRLSGTGPWLVSYDELNSGVKVSRQIKFGSNQTLSPAIFPLSIPVSNTNVTQVVLTSLSDSVYTQSRPVSSTLIIRPTTSLSTDFALSSLTITSGSIVTAQLSRSAVPGTTYKWDFEDGSPNTAFNPTNKSVLWFAPGIKTVTLSAEREGCPSEASSRTITITGSNLLDNPCQAAVLVPVSQTAAFTFYSTEGATPTTGIPSPSCQPDAPINDIWYSFSLAASADVAIETEARTLDGSLIQLLSASACNSTMQEVRCAVANLSTGDEGLIGPILRYNSLPAGRYWVRLGAVSTGVIGIRLSVQTPQAPTARFTNTDITYCQSGTQAIGIELTGRGPWSLTYVNNGQPAITSFGNSSSYGPLRFSFVSNLGTGINQFITRTVTDANFTAPQSSPDTLRIQVAALLSGLSATNITISSAVLNWNATAGGIYELQWRLQGATDWSSADYITENTYALSNLTIGGMYEWRVRIICLDADNTSFSNSTFQLICPSSPSVLSTIGVTSTGAYVAWEGATNLIYTVRFRRVGTTTWTESSTITNSTTYNIIGLTSGNQYEWQVRVICPAINNAYSASLLFTTQCYIPANTSVNSVTDRTANLFWNQGETGTQYQVQYRPLGSSSWITINGLIEGKLTINTLAPNTTYEWQVRTLCSDGQSSGFAGGQQFTTSAPCTDMYSLRVGNWTEPMLWSCGRIPTVADLTKIAHVVTIPSAATGNALGLIYANGGRLIFGSNSKIRLGL